LPHLPCLIIINLNVPLMDISGLRVIGLIAGITANITGCRANGSNHLNTVIYGLPATGVLVAGIMVSIMDIGVETSGIMAE